MDALDIFLDYLVGSELMSQLLVTSYFHAGYETGLMYV